MRLEQSATLAVHVLSTNGTPADSADVLAAGAGLWPARSVITGTDGLAVITGLRGGVYDIRARRGNDISPTELAVAVRRGERKEVSLVLEAGKRVRVFIAEDEHEALAVAGANVALVEEGLSSFPVTGRTDARGIADLGPIAHQQATLFAVAPSHVPRTVPVNATATDVRWFSSAVARWSATWWMTAAFR